MLHLVYIFGPQCQCIQNHPIYFSGENLHIASFDQMFNQNIRNGNSNNIATFCSQHVQGERESKIDGWIERDLGEILMHFVRKKVHHITGKRLFTISSLPLHAYTIHGLHSCPHYAIRRKVKEDDMYSWNPSPHISISLGKCNESLYAMQYASCQIGWHWSIHWNPLSHCSVKAAKSR